MDTLSTRGVATAKTSMRAILSPILADNYHSGTNPSGYVNMGTAENYIMTPSISAFANQHLTTTPQTFTYGPGAWGSARLRNAMSNHMTRHFAPIHPISPSHILFANGLTSICELLAWSISDPNDAILLPSPAYQAFTTDFGAKAALRCIYTAFHGTDQFAPSCVDAYEAAFQNAESKGVKVRALLLCNPHNPLGQCYPSATLIALMQFCQRHRIHLVADEIYALSIYDNPDAPNALPFTSVLAIPDSETYIDKDLLHVFYGFSKDFASGGLRLGCICSRNEAVLEAMGAITQFAWSGSLNEIVGTLMLEDEKWVANFLQLSRSELGRKSAIARRHLEDMQIAYLRDSNAGFFLWIDLRRWLPVVDAQGGRIDQVWDREAELVKRMGEKKFYITDGRSLNAEEAGWFRLIFTQDDEVIEEGFGRLRAILAEVEKVNWEDVSG